ncbi:hypothetical protein X975_26873, partial [Stegodyphus mimosarum]
MLLKGYTCNRTRTCNMCSRIVLFLLVALHTTLCSAAINL